MMGSREIVVGLTLCLATIFTYHAPSAVTTRARGCGERVGVAWGYREGVTESLDAFERCVRNG